MTIIDVNQMIDITAPEIEVEVAFTDSVLWVNIDGLCRLRVCQIKPGVLVINDLTKPQE